MLRCALSSPAQLIRIRVKIGKRNAAERSQKSFCDRGTDVISCRRPAGDFSDFPSSETEDMIVEITDAALSNEVTYIARN
jgi:hypothetical protein